MGTYNVCEAAATLGLRKIVATSSINVLGMGFRYRDFVPHYLPVDENHPDLPQDPYGLSKVVGEDIVDMVHRRTGIPAVSIRPSHVIVPENWPERLAAMEADFNVYYRGIWGLLGRARSGSRLSFGLGNGRRRARRVLHRGRRRLLPHAPRRGRAARLPGALSKWQPTSPARNPVYPTPRQSATSAFNRNTRGATLLRECNVLVHSRESLRLGCAGNTRNRQRGDLLTRD